MNGWAKISASMPYDPKILRVGLLGEWLFVRMILFAKNADSDGYIDDSQLGLVANGFDAIGAMFLRSGATIANGQFPDLRSICDQLAIEKLIQKTESGWQIVAWKKWQTSREQLENLRKKRSEAGKRGNEARWGKRASQTDRTCDDGAMTAGSLDRDKTETETRQTTTADAGGRSLEEALKAKGVRHPRVALDVARDAGLDDRKVLAIAERYEGHPAAIVNQIRDAAADEQCRREPSPAAMRAIQQLQQRRTG